MNSPKNSAKVWHWTSALLLMAGIGCAATAQTTTPVKLRAEPTARERVAMEAAFARADTNGDGRLSREEAVHFPAIEARFDELDTNHDGFLSFEEFMVGAMSAT